jgi:hypothetical protein
LVLLASVGSGSEHGNGGEGVSVLGGSVVFHIVQGDLLDQDVDVIVNAWNRNIIPWWLEPLF